MPSFEITSPHFTGPFDLLLSLIEERKLLVNDISLASVADDFVKYVNTHEEFPIDETAEFLVAAATLMYLKSKSLLPLETPLDEEEEDAKAFERRLERYQVYREQARALLKEWGRMYLFPRAEAMSSPPRFVPGDLNLEEVGKALERIFEEETLLKKRALPEKTVRAMITLSEAMERLKEKLTKSLSGSFKDFSGMGKAEKVEIIVHFLALLELVKEGTLRVTQDSPYEDISLTTGEIGTPTYG
jgi:segregation and condensation protein A